MPEHLTPATQMVGCTTVPICHLLDLNTAHLQPSDRLFWSSRPTRAR